MEVAFSTRRVRELFLEDMERAIVSGVHRAYKHTDAPTREGIAQHVVEEVGNAIHDWLTFGDDQ